MFCIVIYSIHDRSLYVHFNRKYSNTYRVLFMSRPLKKDQSKPSPVLVDPTSLVGRSCREDSKVNHLNVVKYVCMVSILSKLILQTGFRSQQSASRLKLPAYPGNQRDKSSCQTVLNNAFDIPVQEGNSRIASVRSFSIR